MHSVRSFSKRVGNYEEQPEIKNVVIVQSLSPVWLIATSWTAACQASLSFGISRSLLKLMSFELVMPSNHLLLCCPLLLLHSIFPSIRVFSNESALYIRQPEYWSCSFSISSSNEYSGLISFGIDWFELLAIQGLSRVFSRIPIQKHQFCSAQPSLWSISHPYMTTGKTIALTIHTFVSKVMSLPFNTLSRLVKNTIIEVKNTLEEINRRWQRRAN